MPSSANRSKPKERVTVDSILFLLAFILASLVGTLNLSRNAAGFMLGLLAEASLAIAKVAAGIAALMMEVVNVSWIITSVVIAGVGKAMNNLRPIYELIGAAGFMVFNTVRKLIAAPVGGLLSEAFNIGTKILGYTTAFIGAGIPALLGGGTPWYQANFPLIYSAIASKKKVGSVYLPVYQQISGPEPLNPVKDFKTARTFLTSQQQVFDAGKDIYTSLTRPTRAPGMVAKPTYDRLTINIKMGNLFPRINYHPLFGEVPYSQQHATTQTYWFVGTGFQTVTVDETKPITTTSKAQKSPSSSKRGLSPAQTTTLLQNALPIHPLPENDSIQSLFLNQLIQQPTQMPATKPTDSKAKAATRNNDRNRLDLLFKRETKLTTQEAGQRVLAQAPPCKVATSSMRRAAKPLS